MDTFNFQGQVAKWMHHTFPASVVRDKDERAARMLEEALELAQASELSLVEVYQLVEYVFSRAKGTVEKEVGDVALTLAALCHAHDISLAHTQSAVLAENWAKADKIREKQATKPEGILPAAFFGSLSEKYQADIKIFRMKLADVNHALLQPEAMKCHKLRGKLRMQSGGYTSAIRNLEYLISLEHLE
jgi:NTP pyrophosphatase (non-canonical NTP hydrolase)